MGEEDAASASGAGCGALAGAGAATGEGEREASGVPVGDGGNDGGGGDDGAIGMKKTSAVWAPGNANTGGRLRVSTSGVAATAQEASDSGES